MLNNVVLVGRLQEEIEYNEEKKNAYVTLVVPRPFKNADGIYDNDIIKCQLWDNVATNTKEYCHKGDILGIKGRLQCNDETENKLELVADKVTFLSSHNETSN